MGRFCAAEALPTVETLSAFRSSFGRDYGIAMQDGPLQGLLARAVLVLDEQGLIVYRELVPEIAQEPDYQRAAVALGLDANALFSPTANENIR
jgi:thiol peroxidase